MTTLEQKLRTLTAVNRMVQLPAAQFTDYDNFLCCVSQGHVVDFIVRLITIGNYTSKQLLYDQTLKILTTKN